MAGRHIAVIGGGAGGFFAALTAAEADPQARVTVYERGRQWLSKVKISGGGRCNVTHACFDPRELATRYPRGSRELRAAFHRWQPRDTINWFASRGVPLKTEDDGRMFPVTDQSQTVIDCFIDQARKAGIRLHKNLGIHSVAPEAGGGFSLERGDARFERADRVCIAAGSLKASPLTRVIERLGHTVEPLAPSLFAFNLFDPRLEELAGLSVQQAEVRIEGSGAPSRGPVLVTHRGLSGPAILKLSAWEARHLQDKHYRFTILLNWAGVSENHPRETFDGLRRDSGRTAVRNTPLPAIPRRLWERLTEAAGIDRDATWAQLPKDLEKRLTTELVAGRYHVDGKTTNKDEFVTCGGVRLKEIDFRRMESKLVPGLHFAGECLDLDGITGGFNFQAAWTTGRIAGLAMAED